MKSVKTNIENAQGVRIPHPRHWEVLRELVSAPGV